LRDLGESFVLDLRDAEVRLVGVCSRVDARAATPKLLGSLKLGEQYGGEMLLYGKRLLIVSFACAFFINDEKARASMRSPSSVRLACTASISGRRLAINSA